MNKCFEAIVNKLQSYVTTFQIIKKKKKNLITKNINIKLLKEEQDSLGICK